MSITFQCERCGKAFDVDGRFAGKKGRCKQCGTVMLIPANAASRRSETISRDEASVEISPSRRPPSLAKAEAEARSRPSAEDAYGLDDLPGPPSRPGDSPASDEPTLPARARSKPGKKSAGPKQGLYPGGPTVGEAVKRVVVGIALGLLGLLVRAVVIPAIQQGADPTWASRGVIESYMRAQVTQVDAAASGLRDVRDVRSAGSASPAVNGALKGLAAQIRSYKDRKGKLADIQESRAKYAADLARAESGFLGEVRRVMMIEGAWDALAIQPAIDDLASLSSDSGPNQMVGFAPPRFTPPRFIPPPISAPTFPPRPGFGPVPQPGPGPGFGPRNRDRGRGPGQPGPA